MWTHAKSIKVIDRADGKAKVYILARHDGFYEYRGEAEIQGDEYEGDYWSPTIRGSRSLRCVGGCCYRGSTIFAVLERSY
jgi:hypothetical protein